MHRIVQAHLTDYINGGGLNLLSEADQFAAFATHCVIANKYAANFDIEELITSDDDDGIDGVAVVVNEAVITSPEDLAAVFSGTRKNNDVEIVFVQAKRSESFELGDYLKFKEAVLRFANQTPYGVNDEVLGTSRAMFDLLLAHVPKIRNGKPSVVARFVTTGTYQSPAEIETARLDFIARLASLGLFFGVDVEMVDRDELTKLWVSTYSAFNASLPATSYAALPQISGIDEAYLAVVRASDLVANLLTTEDGTLRTHVFEENVRSYLGSDNPVNKSITETLHSAGASRFPVMNNGVTIVSPNVQLQGSTFHLENFQIVNGCQTSNVLFENRGVLGDVMVNVKIVETQEEDVFLELVRATNSQSEVEKIQFLSLRPVSKRVEQYFNTYEDQGRIYFERRDRQYVGLGIAALRIFSLNNSAKCVAAMFCNRPDLAARYPKAMYEELGDALFADEVKEIVYYASCLAMYRLTLLVSSAAIAQNLKRYKWHILPMLRKLVTDNESAVPLNSKQAAKQAQQVIDFLHQNNHQVIAAFVRCSTACHAVGEASSDRLKRQAILAELMAHI